MTKSERTSKIENRNLTSRQRGVLLVSSLNFSLLAKFSRVAALALLALVFASCRTVSDLPAVNLSEPGWTLRQGQAVWRIDRSKPEIAGELLLATRGDRALLQLTKNPLPFVTAQTIGERWQIEFVPQRRRFSGVGEPDTRLLFVHLVRALNGQKPPSPLTFQQTAQHGFTLENPKNGETVSGFFNP
jgi:hypothetical protein